MIAEVKYIFKATDKHLILGGIAFTLLILAVLSPLAIARADDNTTVAVQSSKTRNATTKASDQTYGNTITTPPPITDTNSDTTTGYINGNVNVNINASESSTNISIDGNIDINNSAAASNVVWWVGIKPSNFN